jgi:hypothetical protein
MLRLVGHSKHLGHLVLAVQANLYPVVQETGDFNPTEEVTEVGGGNPCSCSLCQHRIMLNLTSIL